MSAATLCMDTYSEDSDKWSMELHVTSDIMFENWDSLLSSTKFSHTVSRIQLNGFDGQVFRSRAAPPISLVNTVIKS